MKALVAQDLSGPSGLVYTDVEDIADVVDDHVVIDVRAAGMCFPDLLMTRGEYQLRVPAPFIPGLETAGVVRSAPAGSGFAAGDRVSSFRLFFGGWAERVAVPPTTVVPSPESLDDAEAVSLQVNYHTMYFAFVHRAALQPGETVLVLGSSGGVGSAAVQVARTLGARVIAVVRREGADEFVASLGADLVLPLSDGWAKAVREHTGGRGVDVIVDPVGDPIFDDAVRTLAPHGRLLVIGFAGGGIPSVKVNRLLLRNAGVLGVGWGEYFSNNPDAQAVVGEGVTKLVAAGLKPPAPLRYPLSQGRAALERLAAGGVMGKVVLEP
jgi:NADPH:quinone reductase